VPQGVRVRRRSSSSGRPGPDCRGWVASGKHAATGPLEQIAGIERVAKAVPESSLELVREDWTPERGIARGIEMESIPR